MRVQIVVEDHVNLNDMRMRVQIVVEDHVNLNGTSADRGRRPRESERYENESADHGAECRVNLNDVRSKRHVNLNGN